MPADSNSSKAARVCADYCCLVAERQMNARLGSAGLGITGAFYTTMFTVTWQPGEAVDKAKAERLCPDFQAGINRSGKLACQKVELVRLYPA